MWVPVPARTLARMAAVAVLLSLLPACGQRESAAAADAATVASAGAAAATDSKRAPGKSQRPELTLAMFDAYARGIEKEIAFMQASGSHFVSLSRYDEEGLQVAATADLPLSGYIEVRDAVQKVLYELMLHERYAGAEGRARLAGLEPHKREHAEEVLARDPYAALTTLEQRAMRMRLGALQRQYERYMQLATVGD